MNRRKKSKISNRGTSSAQSVSLTGNTRFYFIAAVILATASGAAALGHEVILSRRLIDLLGASNTSISRVFGSFFLGLSLGALYSRRFIIRIGNPWLAAAIAELGVAVLIAPTFFGLAGWIDWIWPLVGNEGLGGWSSWFIKLFLSVAIVLPPAFCMGLFLPCLARAVLRDDMLMQRHGVWLYAFNTIGGMLGILLVSMVSISVLGVDRSVFIVICVNLSGALICAIFSRGKTAVIEETDDRQQDLASDSTAKQSQAVKSGHSLIYLLSFLSGFGVLALEMLAFQVVALNCSVCYYATPTVLMIVIMILAVSAWVLPLINRFQFPAENVIAVCLLLTALIAAVTPMWYRWIGPLIPLDNSDSLVEFCWILSFFACTTFGPIFFSAGFLFPAIASWIGSVGRDPRGTKFGLLLAVNGLGGMVGAEAVFGVILPWSGIHAGVAVVGSIYCAAAGVWLTQISKHQRKVFLYSTVVVGLFACVSVVANISTPQINSAGIAILEERGSREGIVSVIHSDQMGLRIALSGQYVLGGTRFRFDQERMAHLPLMLHANPQTVGCLGLATGITAGAVLEHKSVESLQIAELAPLVFRAADVYFKTFNHEVTTDSRSKVVIEDARIFAAANPDSFDVVIGDLFLPWAPGEARLYTVEHFRSVHQSLKAGGLFCQWLAAYQLNAQQIEIIQSTFCEVFPEAHLFRYNFDDLNPALALVGYRNPEHTLDWQTIADRCNRSRMSNEISDPLMRHVEGFAMLYLGSIKAQEFGEDKNRLSNMMLELSASEVQVSDDRGYFSGDDWFKFVTKRQPKIVLPESTRELPKIANELTIVQVGLRELPTLNTAQVSHLNRMIEDLKAKLPATIRDDKDANWDKWPGEKQLIIK